MEIAIVEEDDPGLGIPCLGHPGWREDWPWLVQGITASGPDRGWDLGLFGAEPTGSVQARWEELGAAAGSDGVVVSRQVHGNTVIVHDGPVRGRLVADPADGHLTRRPGLLLAVSVADCVPVYLVDPKARAVGLLHAGWRGAASGILEGAVTSLAERFGCDARALHLHLGPSICGGCYEVGPEVHEALGEPVPSGPAPVDLPANLARRASGLGIAADRSSRSAHCTRCGDVDLFSHRGGDGGRQMGFLGLRTREAE